MVPYRGMATCSTADNLGAVRLRTAQRSSAHPCAACTLGQRDATRRAERAAEAAGQRTAAHRVLRRVMPLMIRPGSQLCEDMLEAVVQDGPSDERACSAIRDPQ